jgi:hypothetical protein
MSPVGISFLFMGAVASAIIPLSPNFGETLMADRVLPIVRMLFVCNDAVFHQADDKANLWQWQLTEPLTSVRYPPGVMGNFDVEQLFLYAQFTQGVGEFDLCVQMQRIEFDGVTEAISHSIAKSDLRRIDFGGIDRLDTCDFVFDLTMVPFDAAGIYRFSVWSNYIQLPGATAELRVLDGRKAK